VKRKEKRQCRENGKRKRDEKQKTLAELTPQDLRECGEAFIKLFLQVFPEKDGIPWGFNRHSVVFLWHYLEQRRHPAHPGGEVREEFIYGCGVFLGECIIAATGGSWVWCAERGQWGVQLGTADEGMTCFPWSKVRKQLANGFEDSIIGFFDATVDWRKMLALVENGQVAEDGKTCLGRPVLTHWVDVPEEPDYSAN
jgi:hypothetical protein